MTKTTLMFLVALCAGCATRWDASIPPRTVRLVLALDDAARVHTGWDAELRNAVEKTSRTFEAKAGIRFETLRVVTWEAPPLSEGRVLEHLATTIPASDADVIVGVSGGCDHPHVGSARPLGRIAVATTGCAPFMRRAPTLEQLLSHELAHLFGAFHPKPGVLSMMRGAEVDVWDSQTLRVIRLMRTFDFRRGVDGVDAVTREAYGRIYAEGHDPGDANGIAAALRNEGRLLAEAGEIAAAQKRFLEAIAVDPQWYQPHDDLGILHARRQQPVEAVRYLRQAAELAPAGKPDVRLRVASRLDALGDSDGALAVYEQAVRLAPSSPDGRRQLGGALLRRQRAKDAEPHLAEAVRLAPKSADAHGQLAVALGLLGKYEQAIAANRAALALRPDWATVRGNLGYALAQSGKLDDAIGEYRAALALAPQDARTRYNLIDALVQAGRYSEASSEVERATAAGVAVPATLREQIDRQLGTPAAPSR